MDSGSANVGDSHLQNGNNNDAFGVDFLGDIQNYAGNTDHDDMGQFFNPELFESQDFNASMQAQPQQHSQQTRQPSYPTPAFSQHVQRTQSPALQPYSQSKQYTQHSQYPQQIYDQRNMFQPQYDPRIFQQQPSHSPSPLDQYSYNSQSFPGQGAQGQMIQPRPSPSPAPQYLPARQQPYAPYSTFDSRGPTLPQHQDADLLQFASFQNNNQTTSHSFVNPSMLNTESTNINGNYGSMPHRQAQQQYYANLPPLQQQQQQLHGMPQTLQPQQIQGQFAPFARNFSAEPLSNDFNHPNKLPGRPRKDGSIPKMDGSAGSAGSASNSDLEIEEEEPEAPPALIIGSPPTNEQARARYNAVKAVWSPRNKSAPIEKIKSGVIDFGETIRALRDAWKTRNDNLKQAELEGSSTASAAPKLKAEVAQYRQTAETLVKETLLFAHPAIMKSLGENLYTLSAMYSFMLDRVTAVDYDSTLLLAMLKLGEKFATLDDDKLENSKWNKALQRLAKKGSGSTKTLAQKIMDDAKAVTAQNKKAASGQGNGALAAGVKRAREGDAAGPATKRLVKPSSKPLALQNAEKRRAQEAAEAVKRGKAGSAASGTLITPAAAKPKAPLTAPKGTSFASLMSASKKPGTTNAERAATKTTGTPSVLQQVKKEPLKRDSPPAGTVPAVGKGSSFLSSLFVEEKKEAAPKKEEEVPNETPEQKSRRLRKETRRKLRVSWKNDGELVETRFFTHDPDEEIERGDSAMKDAGDTGKEGEMLKRSMAMEDPEDDDEEAADYDPDSYTEPTEIDFSEMASDDCNPDETGIKHGGKMRAESKSAQSQDKFEETSIMAIYATTSDRPDTPQEAPDEGEDDFNPSDEFGEPEDKVRLREKDMYARRRSQTGFGTDGHTDFASSLQALNTNMPQQYSTPTAQQNPADLFAKLAALGLLGSQQAQQPQPAATVPAVAPAFDLASLVANFSGHTNSQPYQQAQPQSPVAANSNESLQAIMARIQQGQSNATAAYAQGEGGDQEGKKGKKGKKAVPLDEQGRPLNYKTKICDFWEKGACLYGEGCNYRHSK